jgi:circadian clock protein KaiB
VKKPVKKPAKKRSAVATARTRVKGASKMYKLRLYITGQTPRSVASIQNLRHVCDEYLAGRFELQVVDIYQQPELAKKAQIIAAPTLIKKLPLPLRKLVGDLSNEERVLMGLDLKVADAHGKN